MQLKPTLVGKIKLIGLRYELEMEGAQRLYELAIQSDEKMQSSLGIPPVEDIFPTLFKMCEMSKHLPAVVPNAQSNEIVTHYQVARNEQPQIVQIIYESQQQKQPEIIPVAKQPKIIPINIKNKRRTQVSKESKPNTQVKSIEKQISGKLQNSTEKQKSKQKSKQKQRKKQEVLTEEQQEQIQQIQSEQEQQNQQTVSRTISQYSTIRYEPIDDPNYLPTIQPSQQISRIIESIVFNAKKKMSTQKRFQVMFQTYRDRGGERTFEEYRSKIIEDLLYVTTLEMKKPKYKIFHQ